MAYQVLYRKYRPSKFEDVVGQDAIVITIKNSIIENKISHAYLFCGPRGIGKTSLAKIIAKAVNCKDLKDGEPCLKCSNCIDIVEEKTSDVIEIDAASNNGVDEIRELKSKVTLAPCSCRYKIYIIDEVHMLSTGAFNALLKMLEEPPNHAIFILATTEVHKIPETVISRCQRFDLKAITKEDIVKKLKTIIDKEKVMVKDEVLEEIAKISNGGLRDSQSILDQAIAYKKVLEIDDIYDINGTIGPIEMDRLLKDVLENNVMSLYNRLDEYKKHGKNFQKILEYLLEYVVILTRNIITKTNKNEQTNTFNYEKLYSLCCDLLEAITKVKEVGNANIILELTLINYMNISDIKKDEKINSEIKEENQLEELVDIEQIPKKRGNIDDLKKIRINNTLATADKEILNKIKEEWNKLFSFTTDKTYSIIVGRLLDAQIKAAGENYIIVSYPNKAMADIFNDSLEEIEEAIKKILKEDKKFIALTSDEWEEEKNKYIETLKNNKEISLLKEDIKLEKQQKEEEKNELIDLFGEEISSIIEFK